MEKLIPRHSPLTCQDVIQSGWLKRVRAILYREGRAIRAGDGFTVEAQVIHDPDRWMPIMLSNGGTSFSDADQLAMVMEMLEGRVPIPDPAPTT